MQSTSRVEQLTAAILSKFAITEPAAATQVRWPLALTEDEAPPRLR